MAAMKTERGMKFPSKAYAYVPDASKPSTWKLRLWSTPTSGVTAQQVGAAIAAVGPKGFRGKRVQIPSSAMGSVKQKIRGAFKKLHPGRMLPAALKKSFEAIEKAVERLEKSDNVLKACGACMFPTLPDDPLCQWCGSPLAETAEELMKEEVKKVTGGIEETDRSYRVRVTAPKGFLKGTMRHKEMTGGVTGLFGKKSASGKMILRTLIFDKSAFKDTRAVRAWMTRNKVKKTEDGYEQPTFPLWLEDDKEFVLVKALIDSDQVAEYSYMQINRKDGVRISLEHNGTEWYVSSLGFSRDPYPTMEQAEAWINETRSTVEASKNKWSEGAVLPLDGGPQKFVIHASFDGLSQKESTESFPILKEKFQPVFDVRFGTSRDRSGFFGWRTDTDLSKACPILKRAPGPAFWLDTDNVAPKVIKTAGAYPPVSTYRETFVMDYGEWRLRHATPTNLSISIESALKKFSGDVELVYDEDIGWLWLPAAKASDPGDRITWAKKELEWVIVPDGATHTKIDVDASATKLRQYNVIKSTGERRFTLGVAYPVAELDAHKDYMTKERLEEAAWLYMAKCQDIGLYHKDGTSGSGQVVESYIYRGPDWEVGDQIIKSGDWLLGVLWSEEAWEVVKSGKVKGYSFQGLAKRVIRELKNAA